MQVKKSKLKRIGIIILILVVSVTLLHTKFAVRCMFSGRLSWEIAFSSETDADYIAGENSYLVFRNKNSLRWLRKQVWEAEIERVPFGTVCSTSPTPAYCLGNTHIGYYGRLTFVFIITTYDFYIDGSNKLIQYADECVTNGSMLSID